MLAKLLKYEMKASARTLVPLYIGTLIVALVCGIQLGLLARYDAVEWGRVINFQTSNLVSTLMFLLFFGLCVAITVLTIMTVIQRFNHSLIGDEGYLMFTLPVTHTQLLGSKLIGSLLWSVAGIAVMIFSGVIISVSMTLTIGNGLFFAVPTDLFRDVIQPALISGIYGLFSLAATILVVYLSIMLAQTEKLNNYRVAAAVVLFFLLNWLFGAVEGILFSSIGAIGIPDGFHISSDFMWAYNMVMACQIVFEAVKGVICFVGTKWLMQNKLNL